MDRKERTVLVTLLVSALLIGFKFWLASASGSLSLRAGAAHSEADAAILAFVLLGLFVARWGVTQRRLGAGIALMLGVRVIVPRFERRQEEDALPITEVVTAAIAYWTSGLLIGIGFATGPMGGTLIALAVTGEILALSVSMVTLLRSNNVTRGLTFALTCALIIGAGLAPEIAVSNLLAGAPLHLVLAFAAAALLTVVVESALAEASSSSPTTAATAAFGVGFLALFIVELLLGAAA